MSRRVRAGFFLPAQVPGALGNIFGSGQTLDQTSPAPSFSMVLVPDRHHSIYRRIGLHMPSNARGAEMRYDVSICLGSPIFFLQRWALTSGRRMCLFLFPGKGSY